MKYSPIYAYPRPLYTNDQGLVEHFFPGSMGAWKAVEASWPHVFEINWPHLACEDTRCLPTLHFRTCECRTWEFRFSDPSFQSHWARWLSESTRTNAPRSWGDFYGNGE